ncbi:ENO [Mytilus coruscus]|uniref:phosphopyruvate hydratase n=1 Tax=Mytilus coruscus TaxID=42192 RepID=A0A6J8BEC2_MYTCO|nr:ENO [Mytilus coruscus]
MQEFMILPTGMYRSIKQELSHAGNKLAMQEFMILPTGMYRSIKTRTSVMLEIQTGMYGSIKQELHDSETNWPCSNFIKQELSHAGNKLAMQEFMILPTGSIKQELQSCGNKLAMQEFMILPTGMYGSIKQGLSHAGNKLAVGIHDSTNLVCGNMETINS